MASKRKNTSSSSKESPIEKKKTQFRSKLTVALQQLENAQDELDRVQAEVRSKYEDVLRDHRDAHPDTPIFELWKKSTRGSGPGNNSHRMGLTLDAAEAKRYGERKCAHGVHWAMNKELWRFSLEDLKTLYPFPELNS